MADKSQKMLARLPRGFVDRTADDIRAMGKMTAKIRAVFELYGFEPADQPLIEYTDALGKFLPDQDRPNEGVFSFQDDDEQWLSLRYDLTAPMARFVARISSAYPSRSAPIARAGCSATRSRDRAGSDSSCNSTPTRSARLASQPTPKWR